MEPGLIGGGGGGVSDGVERMRMTMPQAESVGVWHLQWVLLVSNIYNSCVDTTNDDLVIYIVLDTT